MRTLSRMMYGHLERAAKIEGTLDPDRMLPHFEESLTLTEANTLRNFLGWCHDNGKKFGHGNYQERFREWRASTGEAERDMKESLTQSLGAALDKMKEAMDGGPDGDPAILTPAEATVVYRALTEVYGVKH